MNDFVPAKVVVELYGVQASLTHYGRKPCGGDFWECEDVGIKTILDAETVKCIDIDGVLERPFPRVLTDWAIQAGKLVAERLGAKVVSVRPMKPPSRPLDLGPGVQD